MSWLERIAEINHLDWWPVATPAYCAATLGGGEHDWTEIFLRGGVLPRDTGIAGFVVFLGWAGVLVAWGWLTWRWRQDREMA